MPILRPALAFAAFPLLALLPWQAQAWPDVPLPEGSKGQMVSEHMKYNGLDMQSSRFASTEAVEDVIAFYRAKWPERTVVDQAEGKTLIGHMEGEHYVTIEIESDGAGSRGTIGILKSPAEGQTPNLGEGFYRPAGTDVVSDIIYLDTPGKTRTLVLQNRMSPYVNQQSYNQRMRAEGWKSVGSAPCRPSSLECVARFEGAGGKKMSMTMSRGEGAVTSTVVTIE
ncbi:hypothetical protein [Marilutibacter spongiae]|uniref:Uncharacterized protein n=1 Tax=Marilutibacter spongiae TaxID=2025720 RepID=A0A7W3TPQ8_9GAMM|nr:hypothetical protein [Lysobacter spongiae]MBB1061989.1 hypothetical protein [Lysobacter spongiae]